MSPSIVRLADAPLTNEDANMVCLVAGRILEVSDEPLVSIDFRGNPHSSILDSAYTRVMGGNFAKVLAWYDNEWGYSCRVGDLALQIGG